jgi:mRNA interferase RelE/StbE
MSNPPRWEIILTRQAEKTLRRLPSPLVKRIDRALAMLSQTPAPPGSKRLVGHPKLYRLRVGDWRIIYAVEEEQVVILVLRIAPRGQAYRHL